MQLINFNDSCKISRDKGTKDNYGNHMKEVVYNGPCNYQEGGQVSSSIITRNPAIYLPSNESIVEINDTVEIRTVTGRTIKSLVENVRDVRLRTIKHLDITRIELKQATER